VDCPLLASRRDAEFKTTPWLFQSVSIVLITMINPHKLPSERNRRAVIGCLAACLNIGLASRSGAPTSRDDGADESSSFILEENDNNNDHEDDEKDNLQRRTMMSRTKSLHIDILMLSADLLFLDPDHARSFIPYLDVRFHHENEATTNTEAATPATTTMTKETPEDMECQRKQRQRMIEDTLLRPFLESLSSPEESFQCLTLLIFRFLLSCGGNAAADDDNVDNVKNGRKKKNKATFHGYDARVRTAFKRLGVSIFSYWEMQQRCEFMTPESAKSYATRKFEAVEDALASRLSYLSTNAEGEVGALPPSSSTNNDNNRSTVLLSSSTRNVTFGQSIARNLKIGAAGIMAGTVLAVTGGLAAPALIGGMATLIGASSAVTFVAHVLLVPAATTIFGVGGGTIVANKMSRRTAGLNDFDIIKVTTAPPPPAGCDSATTGDGKVELNSPELSRTICVGGWLRDENDFERPFGMTPRLIDRHEYLCRYCSVYAPHLLPDCAAILLEWKGKEDELWACLRASYRKDPSSLLPLDTGPRYNANLSSAENDTIDELIRAMGLPYLTRGNDGTCSSQRKRIGETVELPPVVNLLSDVLAPKVEGRTKNQISYADIRLYTAWDFCAEYGGCELYFIQWEKELLLELNGSVKEFQMDIAKTATKEALKMTALASLMAAVAIPSAIMSLSNIIDEKWTLAAERADEAGVQLAECLLNSSAGHRPVSLVGFSFGARIILSCLNELARCQSIWERQRRNIDTQGGGKAGSAQISIASFRQSLVNNISNRDLGVVFSREPASIVEDVVLMGVPASINRTAWMTYREVVGGRIVNCYSQNDMILALMYRVKNITSSLLMNTPVGISKVEVPGVENYDVSNLVANHGEYCVAVKDILKLVGFNEPG